MPTSPVTYKNFVAKLSAWGKRDAMQVIFEALKWAGAQPGWLDSSPTYLRIAVNLAGANSYDDLTTEDLQAIEKAVDAYARETNSLKKAHVAVLTARALRDFAINGDNGKEPFIV